MRAGTVYVPGRATSWAAPTAVCAKTNASSASGFSSAPGWETFGSGLGTLDAATAAAASQPSNARMLARSGEAPGGCHGPPPADTASANKQVAARKI